MNNINEQSSTSSATTPSFPMPTSTPTSPSLNLSQTSFCPMHDSKSSPKESVWEKWGIVITIVSVILSGIIGYFSALFIVKDQINDIKTGVSISSKEVEHLKSDVKRLEEEVSKISSISTDVAILKSKKQNSK